MKHGHSPLPPAPRALAALLVAVVASVAVGIGLRVWSTDDAHATERGARVLFSRGHHLWSMNSDGSERRQLTRGDEFVELGGEWSPDHSLIAFGRQPVSHQPQDPELPTLWVARSNGEAPRQLRVRGGVQDYAWAAGSDALVVTNREGLQVVDLHGRVRALNIEGSCPAPSPDGRHLAFCASQGASGTSAIYAADLVRGGEPTVLDRDDTESFPASYSPDGSKLLFTKSRGDESDPWVMASDGSAKRALLKRPGIQNAVAWLDETTAVVVDWSGDRSRWLAVSVADGSTRPLDALAGLDEPIAVATPSGTKPAPTKSAPRAAIELTRVGAHGFFLECRGRGAHTVVLEAPLGSSSATFAALGRKLSAVARVCRYDRPNLGLSDRFRAPKTAAGMASQLARLLAAAHVRRPVLLVGASFGGQIAQLFALSHPRDVSALVLLDPLPPELDREIGAIIGAKNAATRTSFLEQNAEGLSYADLLTSDAQLIAARRRVDQPIVVIRHGIAFGGGDGFPSPRFEALWAKLSLRTASFSSKGSVIVARKSHHRVAEDQPDLVVREIKRLLDTPN